MEQPPKPEPSVSAGTSSTISVSNNGPAEILRTSIDDSQKEAGKQQVVGEEEDHVNYDNLVLDLSLSSSKDDSNSNSISNHDQTTTLKPGLINLIDCFKTDSSSDDQDNSLETDQPPQGNNKETEPRVFSCNYCQRKFYSSQALGGHQNAHKRERTLAKRGQRNGSSASSAAFGHPTTHLSRYSSMASLPLHGTFNRSLGIQVHSMIHKPSFLPSPYLYGQNGWSRRPIDQKPAIGHLSMENFHLGINAGSSATNGAARFETSGRKFGPAMEGGYNWWDSVNNFKTKPDELKLDLSLKL